MKLKRFGALSLALVLALSLTVVPAFAQDFPDVPEDFWGGRGYQDIHEMFVKGYAQGYEDGTFRPNNKMMFAEALLFCARITRADTSASSKMTGVSRADETQIIADRGEAVSALLKAGEGNGNMYQWATNELALAVETGILTEAEIAALSQTNPDSSSALSYLRGAVTREVTAKFLIRAMQLEPMALNLSQNTVDSILSVYPDQDLIGEEYRPYVALLTNYEIVQGKGTGETTPVFHPQGSLTRAEMITMVKRSLNFMSDHGTSIELSEYTSYDFVSGKVTATATAANGDTIVTLENVLTGASQSYSIPSTVSIYENNMLASVSALKRGKFARFNLNRKGAVSDIRLTGSLTEYTGAISELKDDLLTLRINGSDQTFQIIRFTSVAAGQTLGDREIIDYEAGYTSANCFVDEHGKLVAVRFLGGTQLVEGLVENVATTGGATTMTVATRSGVVTDYAIPEGIIITLNRAPGALSINHVGRAVQLRVNTETGKVESVNVDTISNYVQGPITKLGTVGAATSVTIRDRFSGKDVTWPVSSSAVITYNGESKKISELETNWYATASTTINESGNTLYILLDAYPGSTQLTGTLSNITYGSPTVLEVTLADGGSVTYELDMKALPTITRGGKTATVDQLRNGDSLVLTSRYNKLEKIEATAQTANVSGEIQKVTLTTAGVEIDVLLSGESETTKYVLNDNVSVTQGTASSNIYNLKPGYTVALVTTEKGEVLSIDITSIAAATSRNISGTVYTINTTGSNRILTLLVASPSGGTTTVQVDVRSATLMNVAGDSLTLTTGFAAGDAVEAWGSYDGATFVATLVLKK